MINTLNKYYEDGLLTKQTHPTLPLIIWNYTTKVQVEKLWDSTTRMCRGLVTDTDGNIVARPFEKFFNYSELDPTTIPNLPFQIFEKMDGSLGILFYYNDKWIFASRGSFTSDQAVKGRELLKNSDLTKLNNEYTYLFEIIY